MRYPEGHKELVRAKIVTIASRMLRKNGIEGVGIPALMKKAGLTHGGFYKHFGGRDELVVEAVRHAARETTERVFGDDVPSLEATLEAYLSRAHLEHPEQGCVLAALGAEAPQQGAPVRRAFAEVARGFLARVARRVDPCAQPGDDPSDEALRIASRMVGAIVLARLVRDETLADRILRAARAR